jgi:hypothetical protein
MMKVLNAWVVATGLALLAFDAGVGRAADVNDVAESYVRLVLEVGLYDADYVDAYFGPAEWKPAETDQQDPFPAERLGARAAGLIEQLKAAGRPRNDLERLRHAYLERQLAAVKAEIDLLAGKKMRFDEESKALYDVVAPAHDEAYFQGILKKLEAALPGDEDLYTRFNSYRIRFTIPRDKLEDILKTAIAEYRRRTAERLPLPTAEGWEMEFVFGKPWGAAVTYQGGGRSLVEVNAGMPFCVAEVLNVAGHEIYPGHHTHLALLDQHLVKGRGWVEYSILPLHSPLALVSEGIAGYGGASLVMPHDQRVEFERTVLFPQAGLDPEQAETYCRIMELKDELDGALVEAARRYLDGRMDRAQTRSWLADYCLVTPGAAENLISFIEQYRSYVVNYTVGRELVARYVGKHSGSDPSLARRWRVFHTLLSTPQTPSGLAGAN